MNKIRLTIIIMLLTACVAASYGQVTIGSGIDPNKGALLDIKEFDPNDPKTDNTTATKGMLLPRVNLDKLKPTTDSELAKSIGSSETWNKNAHIGLTVYNVKEDQCAEIPKGVFTWTGTEWVYLGQSALAPGVFEFTDPRDGEKYLYGNFGSTAGDWMLENLRYIPQSSDGYPGYSEGVVDIVSPYTDKYYAYPGPYGIYDPATAQINWAKGWKKTGVLYNWPAALNVGGGPDNTPNPDNTNQADGQPGDNTDKQFRGVCPQGWHVPSDKEWNELEAYIYQHAEDFSSYTKEQREAYNQSEPWQESWSTGALDTWRPALTTKDGQGKALKSPCKIIEGADETNGLSLPTKKSGFGVVFAGYAANNFVSHLGVYAYFWSSSSRATANRITREINMDEAGVYRTHNSPILYYSVRCKR
ncbi:MAG: fibrobacter succinogenes major paralogous domain-containing protein [Prevotella sp.]|jgi:uncharacterized protein (TIGR02145 family)|nr:fibrobacter succinogenes major paralogous domain-containing protein [Prevotella sp.]